jgi:hypothetical protein
MNLVTMCVLQRLPPFHQPRRAHSGPKFPRQTYAMTSVTQPVEGTNGRIRGEGSRRPLVHVPWQATAPVPASSVSPRRLRATAQPMTLRSTTCLTDLTRPRPLYAVVLTLKVRLVCVPRVAELKDGRAAMTSHVQGLLSMSQRSCSVENEDGN